MNTYDIALQLGTYRWNDTVEADGGYTWNETVVSFKDTNGRLCASFSAATVLSIVLLPKKSSDCMNEAEVADDMWGWMEETPYALGEIHD